MVGGLLFQTTQFGKKQQRKQGDEQCQAVQGKPEVNFSNKLITLKEIAVSYMCAMPSGEKHFHNLLFPG